MGCTSVSRWSRILWVHSCLNWTFLIQIPSYYSAQPLIQMPNLNFLLIEADFQTFLQSKLYNSDYTEFEVCLIPKKNTWHNNFELSGTHLYDRNIQVQRSNTWQRMSLAGNQHSSTAMGCLPHPHQPSHEIFVFHCVFNKCHHVPFSFQSLIWNCC